ncbi:transcription termination factor MTEF1, chloroplastic-like [Dioscorea cayenensis subsp. rotundata]|uniref:Transcription termination factor MTEF1, chloroplastic-like n=1 Tax=Dioscorea cayennensis subsp. rotundata TaxID=55577 RepID=A0AB40D0R9_DIOCR|nr:transcription termination factor MTEF1, chloroplastic-like [Dioscorea cayenensis subsp. rotundata]
MAWLFKKIYRYNIYYSCSQNHIFTCSICFSTSTTRRETLKSGPVVEYLMTSLGLSSEKAAIASKHLSPLRFPANPESVLNFLRSYGFDESQIKKTCLLASKVAFVSLDPISGNWFFLIQLSLTRVSKSSLRPRILFWRDLLGSVENAMKLFKAKPWLLSYSLERRVLPNFWLLREFGIPDNRITLIVQRQPRLILLKPDDLKALARKVEEMGVPHESNMFVWALSILQKINKTRFHAKLEFMKSLGWSEVDFLSAFQKNPIFLTVSEMMMKRKIDFLVNEAGCKLSELVRDPRLLVFSLDKRLFPRHHVMQVLK